MKDDDDYLLSSIEIDDNHLKNYDEIRPTVIVQKNKQIYNKFYNSKWANLKLFLQEKKSLETSVKLQKQKTLEQFSSKCEEIYKKKVEIQLITKKNRLMFKSYNSNKITQDEDIINLVDKISHYKIINKSKEFEKNSVKAFLFCFRENNDYMLRLIECVDSSKQCEILVPFLCHFFYENFYMESYEQEEILYIIYLLLEKEIDSLYTPSVSTFLDQSFVSKLLTEMGNRYEIKHYIDIILNYLIMDIEELNIQYNSLDIIGNKSEEGKEYYDMTYEDGILRRNLGERRDTQALYARNETIQAIQISEKIPINEKGIKKSVYIPPSKLKNDDNLNKINTGYLSEPFNNNIVNSIPLKKELHPDLFNNINESFIRECVEKETDEIMKHFYVRQLRKLQASKNPDLFNGNKFYEIMKKNKRIYSFAVVQFNKSYSMVINFINELLSNLENETIVPYSIKVICWFIYHLLIKRFKNITKIQCNILICQYLFDKLIFPVLQNPDINDAGKDMIISFNTRKSLSNIYVVCKKLVRGELFSIEDKDYLVIFNKFIINNYHRINKIIDKLIHVKVPEKLIKLTNQFYEGDNFYLEDVKRNDSSINYEYFKENKNDFMQHKSICFTTEQLFLLYNIVNNNKERFIQENNDLQKIFKNLSENINKIKPNKYNYYLIINDEYKENVYKLLFYNEYKMALGKIINTDDIKNNIKYCIEHIISNIEISPNWKWVYQNYDTISTFQFIHKYLTTSNYDSKKYMKNKNKVPLSWYSFYIINNIQKLKNDYLGLNDFNKLYKMIESGLESQLIELRRLNSFLTVNISTKFIFLDHKIKIFNQELENVKSTELNIKTVQFIEKTKIKVCLTTIDELLEISQIYPISFDYLDIDGPHKLILSQKDKTIPCIHKTKLEIKNYTKLKENNYFKKLHCKNINQFCLHLAEYYTYICQDIIGIPKKNSEDILKNKTLLKNQTAKILKKRATVKDIFNIIRECSAKEIIDKYMKFLTSAMEESNIFNIGLNDNNEENIKKIENDKQKALHIIWNYMLKTLCIKICENELNEKDKNLRIMCQKLSWMNPENLDIPKEVFNRQLFKKAEFHIKKMDKLRTPGGMLRQFGLGVQLINSMFVFMLNQKQAEAGDLLPLIIYAIISVKPKRLIFNIKFIKYFMSQNELLGNIGYNLIQAESSTDFIMNMTGKQLKMEEQEFENKCQLTWQAIIDEKNKKKNILRSINDDDDDFESINN